MKRQMSNRTKIMVAFLLLLIVAVVEDLTKENLLENGFIKRDALGGEEKEIQLQLDIEEILEKYEYSIEVSPVNPTREEAEQYFTEVVNLIDEDFAGIKTEVPLKKTYLDGVVEADWSFQPFGLIDSEGKVYQEKLETEETVIQVQVELTCGAYEKIYEFSFLLKKPEQTQEEKIIKQLDEWMEGQLALEGTDQIQIPTELEGVTLHWSEKREYLTPQILLLEMLAVILLYVVSKRKKQEDEKKRLAEMEKEYPDIVNQLALLLGAGMTTRQSFGRLAAQYEFKRKSGIAEKNIVYEAILRMCRRMSEGESERVVYQQFLEEIPAQSYRKLMRILLGNLERGTQGICMHLEEESRLAFEQKILQAKRNGEETSTKMLVPLMLMLIIVMGIVILPALIEFQI